MIVQVTMTRNECFLIKELLPIWSKYADGFVFLDDNSDDETSEFLKQNKEKYNILEVITHTREDKKLFIETDIRQKLFDTGKKYSNKIIFLDTDEYLDGAVTKEQLETFLDKNPDTGFFMKWVQYTSRDKCRVDSFWRNNFHDRMGHYTFPSKFAWCQMHAPHIPPAPRSLRLDPKHLYIAHLQWLDKRTVGIKQYYYKVMDYVNNLEHNVAIINCSDYDISVNNFEWEYEDTILPLRIREDIYNLQQEENNFKLLYIKEQTKKYNIPNLNDWGLGIYESKK
jgi:hypothetical protein